MAHHGLPSIHATTNGAQSVDPVRDEIRAAALSQMVAAVAGARVNVQPFPHFLVQDIFPGDLYWEIVASMPDARLYRPFSDKRHFTEGVSNRQMFALSNANLRQLSGRQRSLWLAIRDALGCPQFKAAVFQRLAGALAYRLNATREAAADTPGYPRPELFRETTGYAIRPHPDTPRKLVTMQIALPKDDGQRYMGTEFYRRSWNPLALLRKPRGLKLTGSPPFLPNSAYAFAVINTQRLRTWHGRTPLPDGLVPRNTILCSWYASPTNGNPDIVEQYYKAC